MQRGILGRSGLMTVQAVGAAANPPSKGQLGTWRAEAMLTVLCAPSWPRKRSGQRQEAALIRRFESSRCPHTCASCPGAMPARTKLT